MSSIPASTLVSVNPSVIGAGGSALAVIAVVLTKNLRVPIGVVLSFPTQAAVGSYFGLSSSEYTIAGVYFSGFVGRNATPAAILFTQYPTIAVGAYLRGGSVASLTLAQLQALSGTLSVAIDGTPHSASVNLAAATSFSNAAQIIQSDLAISGAQAASVTGSIAGTTFTVTAQISGSLAVGQSLSSGTGLGVAANTYVTGLVSGTGGVGTYSVSPSQTTSGTGAITADAPAVIYDSVSGGFEVISATTGPTSTLAYGSGAMAISLNLTQATGAVISQGAAAATPAAFMSALIIVNQNWVNFMTAFDPDGGVGNTQKQAFAAWKNTQNDRFGYVCWDTDVTPTESVPAPTSLGDILAANGDSGTCLIYEATDLNLAAFVCGCAASIDFTETNGRTTFAFRAQAGIGASATDPTVAANLLANGYNFYGAYATSGANYVWFQNGQCTGPFAWFDSYVNQVWLNNQFQVALLNLLGSVKSLPHNAAGNSLIEGALAAPIQAGLNFGAFAPGTISQAEIDEVNTQAGTDISATLQTQGYYLQILPASSAVRAARGSPPCTFWYLDRGSVQKISLSSVAVQ